MAVKSQAGPHSVPKKSIHDVNADSKFFGSLEKAEASEQSQDWRDQNCWPFAVEPASTAACALRRSFVKILVGREQVE